MLRFARNDDFARTLDRLVPEGAIGLAVSGGPDSLALLILAAAARPGRVRAATVDHGLRAESAGEAAMVAACCGELGVPHEVLTVEVGAGASLQAQAREARYAALGQWAAGLGLAAVATGHHADDQAETLLMRLARGSGVGGLSGIRDETRIGDLRLVRPLLDFRKAELAALVARADWPAVDDPANRDERHDRTRVRALLAATPWLDAERLARSAGALADAAEALEAIALGERLEKVQDEGGDRLYRPSPLREIRRRVARLLIVELAGEVDLRGPDLDRLLSAVEAGGSATLAGVLVRAERAIWRFGLAPPRRSVSPRP